MSAIHETAYPRIKPNLNQKEMKKIFMPSNKELSLLNANTRKSFAQSRLGFMITLKCYQYLGRPVNAQEIDEHIKKFIAHKFDIEQYIDLNDYDKSAKKRHIKIIRDYLQINSDKKARRDLMKSVALNAATTKANLADIINCVIDELIHARFELPAFQNLVRLTRAARRVINNENYEKIFNALSEMQKNIIDNMIGLTITSEPNEGVLPWLALKTEAKKPTLKKVKEYVSYVNKLKTLRQTININLEFIAPARIEQLNDEAIIADIDDMKAMRPDKRYALATILIHIKTASAIDDLVQVFISWIKSIEAQAQSKLEEYRLAQSEKTDGFILLLYNTLLALKNNAEADEKIRSIENTLGGKTDVLIEECREYLGLTGENHIRWILKPYKNKRNVIYQILENLTILSSSNDKSIETALEYIMKYRRNHQEWININEKAAIQPALNLLSDSWFKAVTGLRRGKNNEVKKINRHYYEIAVCTVLMDDLSCGDAYVDGGYLFDDPNKQFITWEQFEKEIDTFCGLVKLPKTPMQFANSLQSQLQQTASIVNDNYHSNSHLVINKGLPILKKFPPKRRTSRVQTNQTNAHG